MNNSSENIPKEQKESLYEYLKELAMIKFKAEERREEQLIQQAGQLQAAFSFVAAMISVVISITVGNIKLPIVFYFAVFSSFMILLFLSFILASIAALWRWKTFSFPDINTLKDHIISERKTLIERSDKIEQMVDLLAEVQSYKTILNNRRVKLLMCSMIFFLAAISELMTGYIIGIIIYNF